MLLTMNHLLIILILQKKTSPLWRNLEKQRKDIKRKDYVGIKEQRIDGWIDKLLDENFNYSLLADIHHYKMIVLPNYELIVVRCKKEASKDDFRKMIPTITQKEKRFAESIETKKNGQIVNNKYSVIKDI